MFFQWDEYQVLYAHDVTESSSKNVTFIIMYHPDRDVGVQGG